MSLSRKLALKFKLSKEDIEDVESEIAISNIRYGYERNHEHILIDYLEKFRDYKRVGENNKRECVIKTEEYSEVDFKRSGVGAVHKSNIGYDNRDARTLDQHQDAFTDEQLEAYMICRNNCSGRTRQIIDLISEGESPREVSVLLGISESRVSQILENFKSRIQILQLADSKNLASLAKVVKWGSK